MTLSRPDVEAYWRKDTLLPEPPRLYRMVLRDRAVLIFLQETEGK